MEFYFDLGSGLNSGSSSGGSSTIDEVRLIQLENTVSSNTQRIQKLEEQIKIVVMTQAEYDALESYAEKTLYVLT